MHTRMPDAAAVHLTETRPRPATRSAAATSPRAGRLAVEFLAASGRPSWGRLTQRPTGTLVTAVGTVTVLHVLDGVLGVTLTGSTGDTVLCSVDSDHYFDLCSHLFDGTEVEVSGKVRRPAHGPSPLVDALIIRPSTTASDNSRQPLRRAAMALGGVR
ncbi:hypothetical protein [Streptomyces sp. NBC_01264]|uniref:hypothetical protein n=1 Tax=Streptomyces sp. NBC_01264 TaxID=2903804 RepID=UPI00224CA053|nr:hypothetical protein [Streptomyces sp. NBC_01264]MCX4784025.1 hypothetical protein [Streptomyces sp. NBC_01264]